MGRYRNYPVMEKNQNKLAKSEKLSVFILTHWIKGRKVQNVQDFCQNCHINLLVQNLTNKESRIIVYSSRPRTLVKRPGIGRLKGQKRFMLCQKMIILYKTQDWREGVAFAQFTNPSNNWSLV